jgi:hypothetical protein
VEYQVATTTNEPGYAWSIALETINGDAATMLVDRAGAIIVLLGTCTPL